MSQANENTNHIGTESADQTLGFFGKLGNRMSSQKPDGAPRSKRHVLKTAEALLLLQNYEESGQGWFWSTDAEGRISYITESVATSLEAAFDAAYLRKP